jgi:hypothetical protein
LPFREIEPTATSASLVPAAGGAKLASGAAGGAINLRRFTRSVADALRSLSKRSGVDPFAPFPIRAV